jgi:hypothetical protein
MVEKLGDLTRSYWPVVVSVLAAAVAWGVLYATANNTAGEVHDIKTAMQRYEVGLAGVDARQKADSSRIADLSDRLRALEQRR